MTVIEYANDLVVMTSEGEIEVHPHRPQVLPEGTLVIRCCYSIDPEKGVVKSWWEAGTETEPVHNHSLMRDIVYQRIEGSEEERVFPPPVKLAAI